MKKSDIFGKVVSVIVITFGGSLQVWTATYNKTKAVRAIKNMYYFNISNKPIIHNPKIGLI